MLVALFVALPVKIYQLISVAYRFDLSRDVSLEEKKKVYINVIDKKWSDLNKWIKEESEESLEKKKKRKKGGANQRIKKIPLGYSRTTDDLSRNLIPTRLRSCSTGWLAKFG